MLRQIVTRDEYEVNLLLRVRQMEHDGDIGATLDFIRHTIQPIRPAPPTEYLDPQRPKPRPPAAPGLTQAPKRG